jgi:hypothetical protein
MNKFYCCIIRNVTILMACNIDLTSKELIEWKIEPNVEIFNSMFEDNEYAGTFAMHLTEYQECDKDRKKCSNKTKSNSKLDTLNKGSSASVKTTDGYCNFHTHPMSCYFQEKCIWGWPSGEDMRETVGFMLRNNLFHLVFAIEGAYLIQVNPNFIGVLMDTKRMSNVIPDINNSKKMMSADGFRGIVVSLIETYFKATHGHRTMAYNIQHGQSVTTSKCDASKGCGICVPNDWINFANKFKLDNLDSKVNSCSKLLPCSGTPEYNNTNSKAIGLEEYIKLYGGLEAYDMNTKGSIRSSRSNSKKELDMFKHILTHFKTICKFFTDIPTPLSYGGEKWEKGQWFHCKIFYNEFKCPKTSKFVAFNDWLKRCNDISNNTSPLPKTILSQYTTFKDNKAGFRFSKTNCPKVLFKPFKLPGKSTTCSLIDGNAIHDWINTKNTKNTK